MKTLLLGNKLLSELHAVQRKFDNIPLSIFIELVTGQPEICRPIKEYLYMDHIRLFGQDKERALVMSLLFETIMAGEGNVDIIPIVSNSW